MIGYARLILLDNGELLDAEQHRNLNYGVLLCHRTLAERMTNEAGLSASHAESYAPFWNESPQPGQVHILTEGDIGFWSEVISQTEREDADDVTIIE